MKSMNSPVSRSPIRPWMIVIPAVCLIVAGIYVVVLAPRIGMGQGAGSAPGGGAGGKKAGARGPIPVVAVEARTEDLPIYLEGLGSVTPLHTVILKSRVDGQLLEVHFEEGQAVKAGELLATIDPRPFQVQLLQAEGQMARDEALLQNAKIDLDRVRKLYGDASVSRQEVDTAEALVRQYEGAVRADGGPVEYARLQLDYAKITSPIGGRVGLRLVDPGNIVRAADAGGLVTIVQVQPISVVFTIPEDDLPPVLAKVRAGEKLPVEAWDRARKRKLADGLLRSIDNQVDPGTGTVRLKADFANEDERLFPNGFVNARLLVDVRRGATVVPAAAIQRGPQGTFVYLVKADRTVEVRPVAVGETETGQAAIASGLVPGEAVVVDGADRLREGAAVEPKSPGSGPDRPPGAAGGAESASPKGSRKPGR
jgi:multidrug efflux system membrane fusion protein